MPPNDVRQEEAKKNGSVSSAVADEVEDGYEYWHLLPWFNSLYERARARDFWNELLERPRLLLGYHLGPEQNHADAALEERIFTIDGHTTPSHHYEPVIHLQSALPDETGSSNFTLSNGDSASTVSSRET
uniref:Uncharacterized protein n=1 Tax=Plectus sambesii TaxID=2011161 RepID=A0A914VD64_9BILA